HVWLLRIRSCLSKKCSRWTPRRKSLAPRRPRRKGVVPPLSSLLWTTAVICCCWSDSTTRQVASVEVGIGKARTAAIFRRPSKVFEDQVRDGRVAALALPGATPLQGGVPIVHEGKGIGAIGVSGNTPQEDEDIAKAGAASTAVAIGN